MSILNMAIERPFTNFYLMMTVMFAIFLTVYEIFANHITIKFDLEIKDTVREEENGTYVIAVTDRINIVIADK